MMVITIIIIDRMTLVDSYSHSDDVVIHIVLKSLVVWSTMNLQTSSTGVYYETGMRPAFRNSWKCTTCTCI